MFRGRYEHTIDSKGRVSIPSKFREVLSESYDGRLIVTTLDGCLRAYPYQEWKVFEEKIASLPEFKRETRVLLRYFYSNAIDCPIDKVGRIMLPQNMREYAKIEKDAVFVGALNRFEIWSKAVWSATEASVSIEEIGNMLEELGL